MNFGPIQRKFAGLSHEGQEGIALAPTPAGLACPRGPPPMAFAPRKPPSPPPTPPRLKPRTRRRKRRRSRSRTSQPRRRRRQPRSPPPRRSSTFRHMAIDDGAPVPAPPQGLLRSLGRSPPLFA